MYFLRSTGAYWLPMFIITCFAQPSFAQSDDDWATPIKHAQSLLNQEKYDEALAEFKLQANLNNGLAQFNTALFYQFGWGVKIDNKQACHWFELAAKSNIPFAQLQHGHCIHNNILGKNQQAKALHWYESANNNGVYTGECAAGEMYLSGTFIDQNINKGLQMCTNAANKGDLNSMGKLGKWYFTGQYVEKNYELAFILLNESAPKNVAESAFYLAQYFDRGIGMDINLKIALHWYEKSSIQGYQAAYLPTSALYWKRFLDADTDNKSALLAKSYLWTKTAVFTSTNVKDNNMAQALLAQIEKEMPNSWHKDLDVKVAEHQHKFHSQP